MFGSQKVYGGHHNQSSSNNNNYGNNPAPSSYSSAHHQSSSDSFWGNNRGTGNNNHQQRQLDPAIANDSLYGYQNSHPLDKSNLARHANLANNKNEKYGNLGSIVPQKKTTTWASIASQPAKSQPKCLKAKMAAGLTGTTSKFLPPTVTMDAMSWDSKNGSVSSSGGKPAMIPSPPPAVMSPPPPPPPTTTATVPPSMAHPLPADDLYAPDPHPMMAGHHQSHAPPPQPPAQVIRENSWNSSNNGNTSPPVDSIPNNSDNMRHVQNSMPNKAQPPPMMPNNGAPVHEHNGNHSHANNMKYPPNQRNDYHPTKPMMMMDNPPQPQQYSRPPPPPPQNVMREPHHHPVHRDHLDDDSDDLPPDAGNPEEDLSHLLLEKLRVENNYNPEDFDLDLENARFFIIKSYSEDDIHRSIKYSIWCSTEHGNKRLDNAFRQQEDKGPIYLFFSVNRSGHFCGVAQMTSHVDYNASSGVWSQDKWKGQFKVAWIYVKDVPNDELRHITLENNENKPVTNSRDTQEVPYEKGKMVMAIIHGFKHRTSIFDDFLHYEKKQEEELHRKPGADLMPGSASSPPPSSMHSYYKKMQSPNSQQYHHHANSGREPPQPTSHNPMMSFRGGGGTNNNNYNKPRSYQDQPRDHQNRMNADYPPPQMPRGDYGRNPNTGNNFRNNDRVNNYGPPSQASRDHHRNDYHGGGPRDYGRDPYYSAPPAHQQYNQRDQGGYYQGGPPSQRDYPPNDYHRGGGGGGPEYPPPRDHGRNHHHHPDRVQSWRN